MNTTKPLQINADLARRLKSAAENGETLPIQIDNHRYLLSITRDPATRDDIWEGYDPEQVRAEVRRSAARPSHVAEGELDSLIAEIRAQRDQATDTSHL